MKKSSLSRLAMVMQLNFYSLSRLIQLPINRTKAKIAYHSPSIVIVKIHLNTGGASRFSTTFSCVHKRFGKADTKVDIIAASSPLPAFLRPSFVFRITAAFATKVSL